MGDPKAVEEARRMFSSNLTGHVSNEPIRNYKYLFVASATLASRSAISGGMDTERAYNISDLYIQRMDDLKTVEEVKALHARQESKILPRCRIPQSPVSCRGRKPGIVHVGQSLCRPLTSHIFLLPLPWRSLCPSRGIPRA